MMVMQTVSLLMPLGLASLLGALVGLERQWRQRQAGLRTNALVALGAASFTLMSMMVEGEVSPTRVAAQVVSGIGFLGAGVIMKEGVNIRGLNTAATLWCSAAIGVMVGAGYFLAATMITAVVLITNTLLRPLVVMVNRQPLAASHGEVEWTYDVSVTCREPAEEAHIRALLLQGLLTEGVLRLQRLESENIPEGVCIKAHLLSAERRDLLVEKLVGRLSLEPSVCAAGWDAHLT